MLATRQASAPTDWVVQVVDFLKSPLINTFQAPVAYHNPQWTGANLGDAFGVTLDASGNVYVAAARVYSPTGNVTWGAGGPGVIYKLANGTGAISTPFATLPAGQSGLGNLAFDCAHNSLYVSDFDNGLIYQFSASGGAPLTSWDHGMGLPAATSAPTVTGPPAAEPAIPDGGSEPFGFTPPGRRVWAVQPYGDELFYAVWWRDLNHPNAARSNEIWSIRLGPSGNFVPPARLEIRLPPLTSGGNTSAPVSDISFSSTGYMLVAERSMVGPGTASAHQSRVLQFRPAGGGWLPSPAVFEIGRFSNHTNAGGGDDYDYGPGGLDWATGDALIFQQSPPQFLYGYQGSPATGTGVGGGTLNSTLIDDDGISAVSKFRNGDLEITCPACSDTGSPGPISGPTTTCATTATYCVTPKPGVVYNWTVTGGAAASLTGPCITVTWSGTGAGTVAVTGTTTYGCKAPSTTLPVAACQQECCLFVSAPFDQFTLGAGGTVTFAAKVTAGMPTVARVTADLLTTSLTFTPPQCGSPGPVNSYLLAALPTILPSLFVPQPINPPSGREAIWLASSAGAVTNLDFPMRIQLPLPPTGKNCHDSVSFCIKYSVGDQLCRTCDTIFCYGPLSRNPLIQ